MSKKDAINHIANLINKCKKCKLHLNRNNPVVGEGNSNASIIFIGEAPGKNEDNFGRPFIGRAGKILDEMLDYIGLKRNDVYMSNIIKCRPPKNRNPLKIEIEKCSEYLDKQLEIIRPKVIVPLGRYAISYIFNKFNLSSEKVSSIHGKIFSINSSFGKIKIIPIYHPAVVIYNKNIRYILLNDFKKIEENL